MGETNVALFGCGAWGMNHLRTWTRLGRLRAVCDPDRARLKSIKEQHPELAVFEKTAAVLQRPDITAVVIATPAPTHVEVVLEALHADKDVLVEKPMALTAAEGEQLVATAQKLGRILMVGHVLEYHPAILKIRELISDGSVGRIQYIYSNRLNLGRIRTEENALWSFAPHDIALILRLAGAMPDQVSSHGGNYLSHDVADVTLTTLHFPNNVRAHIHVSWLHPFKEQRFVVVGDRQMAVFDDTLPWPDKLVLYPHTVSWLDGRVPVANRAEAISVPLEPAEPLLQECEHFLHCIETREQPLTNGESGLKVLRVLEAAQWSLEHHSQPVDFGQAVPAQSPSGPEEPSQAYFSHPTATIDTGAVIGEATYVWHYSHIMPKVLIGKHCVLAQNVFVANNVRIGDGVKIQNNVSVFDGVVLEDNVFCGPSMVFTNVMNPRSAIMRKNEFRRTLVRRGATLGANSTIICGVTIGQYAFVGAGAVVTRDVPDYALVFGSPARIRGWVCECGEKIEFAEGRAVCVVCHKQYRQTAHQEVRQENWEVENV